MKNILKFGSVLCLGVLFSAPANALVSFGVKGGMNLTTTSVESGGVSVDGYGYGIGYMGGVSADAGLGPISVGVDVLYTQRKIEIEDSVPLIGGASSTTSGLHIPVVAKLSLLPMVNLQAGGYYAVAIGKTKTVSAGGATLSEEDGDSDFGATAGIGVSLAMLSIEARYNFGLKNQSEDPDSQKLRSIDVLVGFMF